MVVVAEWFRRKIVVLVYVSSNLTKHPKKKSFLDPLRYEIKLVILQRDLKNGRLAQLV